MGLARWSDMPWLAVMALALGLIVEGIGLILGRTECVDDGYRLCGPCVREKVEPGCKCQRCGRDFRVDLNVPDELWDNIAPPDKPRGAGLLCGPCIMAALEDMRLFLAFRLIPL